MGLRTRRRRCAASWLGARRDWPSLFLPVGREALARRETRTDGARRGASRRHTGLHRAVALRCLGFANARPAPPSVRLRRATFPLREGEGTRSILGVVSIVGRRRPIRRGGAATPMTTRGDPLRLAPGLTLALFPRADRTRGFSERSRVLGLVPGDRGGGAVARTLATLLEQPGDCPLAAADAHHGLPRHPRSRCFSPAASPRSPRDVPAIAGLRARSSRRCLRRPPWRSRVGLRLLSASPASFARVGLPSAQRWERPACRHPGRAAVRRSSFDRPAVTQADRFPSPMVSTRRAEGRCAPRSSARRQPRAWANSAGWSPWATGGRRRLPGTESRTATSNGCSPSRSSNSRGRAPMLRPQHSRRRSTVLATRLGSSALGLARSYPRRRRRPRRIQLLVRRRGPAFSPGVSCELAVKHPPPRLVRNGRAAGAAPAGPVPRARRRGRGRPPAGSSSRRSRPWRCGRSPRAGATPARASRRRSPCAAGRAPRPHHARTPSSPRPRLVAAGGRR